MSLSFKKWILVNEAIASKKKTNKPVPKDLSPEELLRLARQHVRSIVGAKVLKVNQKGDAMEVTFKWPRNQGGNTETQLVGITPYVYR